MGKQAQGIHRGVGRLAASSTKNPWEIAEMYLQYSKYKYCRTKNSAKTLKRIHIRVA